MHLSGSVRGSMAKQIDKDFLIVLESAKNNIKIADHMVNITYKLVKDPKLFLVILERLDKALTFTMKSILFYERYYKKIPTFREDFNVMHDIFKARCLRRYNFNNDYILLIKEVNDVIKKHKQSPMEFKRDGKFVICSDDYKLNVVSDDSLKKKIEKAKAFIREADYMLNSK